MTAIRLPWILLSLSQLFDYSLSESWKVPKCCPLGYNLDAKGGRHDKECMPTKLEFLPEYWGASSATNDTTINVIIGNPCPYGKYRLEPEKDSSDEFRVFENGSLFVPFQFEVLLNTTEYCLEVFDTEMGPNVLPLICFPPSPSTDMWKNIAMIVYPVGLLLSIPFLLATLLTYIIIPELRDTQGKTLCCHISCLIVAYIALAAVQLTKASFSTNMCICIAFLIQFSFLACFFWLNVLCFDTWFRVTSPLTYLSWKAELKRFFWYSIYAWSLPLILLAYTVIMEFTPIIPPSYLKPNVGYTCWFDNDNSALRYFYGPMGFILISNVVFFILSARQLPAYIYTDTIPSNELNQRTAHKRRAEMFKQCAQLFAVMGVNWIMELISWALGGPAVVWFATDILNTLQGIIIFYIFIVRVPRVKRLLGHWYESLCHN